MKTTSHTSTIAEVPTLIRPRSFPHFLVSLSPEIVSEFAWAIDTKMCIRIWDTR